MVLITVGGEDQGAGASAGFNKFWHGGDDINQMINNCRSSYPCMNGSGGNFLKSHLLSCLLDIFQLFFRNSATATCHSAIQHNFDCANTIFACGKEAQRRLSKMFTLSKSRQERGG